MATQLPDEYSDLENDPVPMTAGGGRIYGFDYDQFSSDSEEDKPKVRDTAYLVKRRTRILAANKRMQERMERGRNLKELRQTPAPSTPAAPSALSNLNGTSSFQILGAQLN